jgi:hypothetical protein
MFIISLPIEFKRKLSGSILAITSTFAKSHDMKIVSKNICLIMIIFYQKKINISF